MKNAIGGEHGFKIHTTSLLKEIVECALRENQGVLKVPLNTLLRYLGSVATRASQINDPILNKIMCDMTLYEVADLSSPEYDAKVISEVYRKAKEQREMEAIEANGSN